MPIEPGFVRVDNLPTPTGIIRAAEMQLCKYILPAFLSYKYLTFERKYDRIKIWKKFHKKD